MLTVDLAHALDLPENLASAHQNGECRIGEVLFALRATSPTRISMVPFAGSEAELAKLKGLTRLRTASLIVIKGRRRLFTQGFD